MADSKSASRMESWRNYFRSSNVDIFETIERAITVAAFDYPKEFRIRRDGIAQTLFSCKLIKCCGCDKLELASPDDEVLKCSNGNESKGSNKEISSSGEDDLNHNNQISDDSYEVAEALTDEIEEETQMFGEVMRIKEIINNSKHESESVLYNSLRKLQLMALSVETLKATEIGKSVNSLRRHGSKNIAQIARTLIEVWKEMVDEWVAATEKRAVSEATPESLNPSVVDEEEEGLPSPPMDDLAFFYPHDTSLELSEFFDGMDEYAKEKQSGPTRKQQKPSNGSTMVPKKESDGSVKMKKKQSSAVIPIQQSIHGTGRVTLNTERKVQSVPKRPAAPHQTKPNASGDATGQDKFEAAKRKLHERYQQAENAKKQRTIQVMELHDLPKQQQQFRPGNNHNRHRSSYMAKK